MLKLGLGVLVLALLNYAFNELMDESGLHIIALTARLPPGTNATARGGFRARAELAGAALVDASEIGAQRFELVERRGDDADAPFTALFISRQRHGAASLPSWLAAELGPVESVLRLTTVFPERGRWTEAAPAVEPGELGELGRVSLLVQQNVWTLASASAADAFRRSWPELGYNSLGEPGVVRCDLLTLEEETGAGARGAGGAVRFVARKVLRDAAALAAHESSEHYVAWRERLAIDAAGEATVTESRLYDTLLPRSSAYPFRSRWK